MKNVYYVQRLLKPTNTTSPFSFGGGLKNGGISKEGMEMLKKIMAFDYMGSSEFEWGAVPVALQRLADKELNAIAKTIVCKEQNVYIIAPEKIIHDVEEWIKLASEEKQGRLKESLNFKRSLDKDPYSRAVGWLKIEDSDYCEEPFMFFIDKEMFESVCKLFEINI